MQFNGVNNEVGNGQGSHRTEASVSLQLLQFVRNNTGPVRSIFARTLSHTRFLGPTTSRYKKHILIMCW